MSIADKLFYLTKLGFEFSLINEDGIIKLKVISKFNNNFLTIIRQLEFID